MSSISSVNGSGSGFSMMMSGMKRPDPSKMVDDMFSKLDTTSKGYLDKSDLQSALSQSTGAGNSNGAGSTSSSPNVDEIFQKLDSNGDGKLTKSEMASGMSGTAKAGKGGGMPPPPPSSGGANSAAGASGASSTQSGSSMKTYDPADANQDGKVSEQERIAYAQAQQDKASAAGDASASTTSTNSDARVLKQIMDLMRAYSSFGSSSNSGLSITA